MTNQLTHTDPDDSTMAPALPPLQMIPSTSDDQPKQPGGGRRWTLMAGGATLAVTAVVGFAVVGDDSRDTVEPIVEQRPGSLIIQDEIDAALAERDAVSDPAVQRPGYLIIQDEIDAARAGVSGVSEEQRSTAQIVQDEVDAALAEAASTSTMEPQRPAYLIVQDEVDAAMAERSATSSAVTGG